MARSGPSVGSTVSREGFEDFMRLHEVRLRHALIALCGGDVGREAACEAWAYGFEHWDRIAVMENPVGYLYSVGRTHGLRALRRRPPSFESPEFARLPEVEPELPAALARLTERQRSVVVLVHCFQWSLAEVAGVMDLSKSSVQNHLERAMTALRRELGVVSS